MFDVIVWLGLASSKIPSLAKRPIETCKVFGLGLGVAKWSARNRSECSVYSNANTDRVRTASMCLKRDNSDLDLLT